MPRPIPFPTKPKELPVETETLSTNPTETSVNKATPISASPNTETPIEKKIVDKSPEVSPPNNKELTESPPNEKMPSEFIEENCVVIDGKKIEIKPTKVGYFRNKAAATYNIMKNIPLTELFSIQKGTLDEERDGDQIVFDFLIAAFDDKEFVKKVYNDLTADQIEKVVQIFGRINHIEAKYETQRKNREAQGNR